MKGKLNWQAAIVTEVSDAAPGVRVIEFAVRDADAAFSFAPGSHSTFEIPLRGEQAQRSYSCLPSPPGTIRVGVKRHAVSRGGSAYMWALEPGMEVRLSLPENRFELSWRAPSYLLVAGGIGITPLYGMALALARRKIPVRLAYAVSKRSEAAFAEELEAALGEDCAVYAADEGNRLDLGTEIGRLPPDGELYVCGPVRMLNEAKALWADAGRPSSKLRFEVFGAVEDPADRPFRVRLSGENREIEVRPGQTMLDALTEAGVDMIWDCLRGECGLCAVDVVELDGAIDHRDVFFSSEQKAENRSLCTCVSRLMSGSATIDTGFRPGSR
ncbi:PDR/VanB family oxidoreductase [Nisaea sediminum]|uniref:PDR/VanB family oxidoreductase n=1 Tax=Nisaea sediminum TaxID=2775867 RepID=UPI00186781C8|nr:PDR/VanB family oxidoreductase [Nisaea sediminum]